MKKPKPIIFFDKTYIILNIWLGFSLLFSIIGNNYIGILYNAFLIILSSIIHYLINKKRKIIYAKLMDMYSIHLIITNIKMKKEDDLITFNFIFPSERIVREIEKLGRHSQS